MTPPRPSAEQLAGYTLDQQHPRTAEWSERRRRLSTLAEQHRDDLTMMVDLDLARSRRDLFAPHLEVESLLNRWVDVTRDLSALLSMRWEGGDPSRPFVDASATSRAPQTPADLGALTQSARAVFGAMQPRYLRVWSATPPNHFPGTLVDKRVLAAPLSTLRAQPVPAALALRAAADIGHHEQARAAYEAVDQTHPDHRAQATLMDQDALRRRCDDGMLFDVLLDGQWCGYIATRRGAHLGLAGFGVAELILTPAARGKRFGRHLSILVAQALPDVDGVLTGTVHAENRGAMIAAEEAGRIDVGGWLKIPLAAGPA